jgi:hypothetical protein
MAWIEYLGYRFRQRNRELQKGTLMRKQSVALLLGFLLVLAASASAQAPAATDPVGVWNMQTDAQGQVSPFVLTITKEGNALKGKIASELYGNQDLPDLKFENGTLTYTRKLDIGGQAVEMLFKGKIEGDKVTGAYTIMEIELPVTGTRKSAASK